MGGVIGYAMVTVTTMATTMAIVDAMATVMDMICDTDAVTVIVKVNDMAILMVTVWCDYSHNYKYHYGYS